MGSTSRRPLAEHLQDVQALLAPLAERIIAAPPEEMSIHDPALVGRVSAASHRAPHALPRVDDSQMDGFAVRSADLVGASADAPRTLPLGRATAAGDAPAPHQPGTASPVMTGAPLPVGADAVVPVEDTAAGRFGRLSRAGDAEPPSGDATFSASPPAGSFVRRAGSDVADGEEILPAGARLTPARLGVLAATGADRVLVRRRCRILLCTTGDELAPQDAEQPRAGLVRDATGPMLAAALRAAGADVRGVRSSDSTAELLAALAAESDWADLLVTCGGISAGAYEVVREALSPLGARFVSVALQPGGPQGLGSLTLPGVASAALPVLCFPGNPVSAVVSTELLLLPWLRELAGRAAHRPTEQRRLAEAVDSPAAAHQVRRARILEDGTVHLTGPSSHLLGDLARADALAHLPVGVEHLEAGATIEIWRIDD